jgi:hypothetical protein
VKHSRICFHRYQALSRWPLARPALFAQRARLSFGGANDNTAKGEVDADRVSHKLQNIVPPIMSSAGRAGSVVGDTSPESSTIISV